MIATRLLPLPRRVRLRNGALATCTRNLPPDFDYPLLGEIDGWLRQWAPDGWTREGRYLAGRSSPEDIVALQLDDGTWVELPTEITGPVPADAPAPASLHPPTATP